MYILLKLEIYIGKYFSLGLLSFIILVVDICWTVLISVGVGGCFFIFSGLLFRILQFGFIIFGNLIVLFVTFFFFFLKVEILLNLYNVFFGCLQVFVCVFGLNILWYMYFGIVNW